MPFPFKHSNRSRQALNEPPAAIERAAVTPSASHSQKSFSSGSGEGRSTTIHQQSSTTTTTTTTSQTFEQPYEPRNPEAGSRASAYHNSGGSPPRSVSTQYQQQQTYPQELEASPASPSPAGSSVDDLVLDTQRLQNQGRRHTATIQSPVAHHKKRSIFDRMRGTNSNRPSEHNHSSVTTQGTYSNTGGLARRLSRRHEGPPVIRTSQQRNSVEQHQRPDWQPAAQGSRSHLPSPRETPEDNGLDPYLITNPEEGTSNIPQISVNVRGQQQPLNTIRTIQSDSDSPLYSAESQNDTPDQQFQKSPNQGYYHQSPQSPSKYESPESIQQYRYELPDQIHSQQQLHSFPSSPSSQYPPQDFTPDSASIHQHESPFIYREEQRPGSVQSNNQSPISLHQSNRVDYPERTTSIQGPIPGLSTNRPLSQHLSMAPQSTTTQQNRRSADSKQTLQAQMAQSDGRDPPAYRQQQQQQAPSNNTNQQPATSPLPPQGQGPNYRGGPPQREQYNPSGGDQGRSTPPPAPGDRDVNEAYKELLQKYKKVKGLYFDKTASVEQLQGQVEQLQNTLANQRLSQSRTSLDDGEYTSRFQRLDGAITNLAFNIRKDWRTVPAWLSQSVNRDAMSIGKQEMTAVGRACISRFLVDEIFNRTFHPGLETELSLNLKNIEQNIRRFSPAINNQEESDALTSKVVQWRLTTLDGLKDVLNSPESEEHKRQFSKMVTSNLTANLINYLQEPVPGGIEEAATTIVELAVSIAANIPLESRDVVVTYPMPNDLVQRQTMKVEAGIPALEHPGAETNGFDSSSVGSNDKDDIPKEEQKSHAKLTKEKSGKGGMLQAMMGGGNSGKKMSISSQGSQEPSEKIKSEDGAHKVRFAGFMTIDIRGRQVLFSAPVWTMG